MLLDYWNITTTIEVVPHALCQQYTLLILCSVPIILMVSSPLSVRSAIQVWSSVMEVEVAIPYIFLLPARAVFCCRNKQHAKKLVLFLLVYVLLWTILQLLIPGLILAATVSTDILNLCTIIEGKDHIIQYVHIT